MLNHLRMRLDEADAVGAALRAHALKGAAAAVSAGSLCALAKALEQAGGAGAWTDFAELLPRATGEFKEAVEAFGSALEAGQSYDLICMDIMMPETDGREAVRQVRAFEESRGIFSSSGVKIIMTTAVNEIKEVAKCFAELCDAYLVKPIDLKELDRRVKSYQLVQ